MSDTERDLPEVAGKHISGTLAFLERRARLEIGKEQAKIAPDNALIAVLCDTVRLVREQCDVLKAHLVDTPQKNAAVVAAGSELHSILNDIYYESDAFVTGGRIEMALNTWKGLK